jgi:hypothetical protein
LLLVGNYKLREGEREREKERERERERKRETLNIIQINVDIAIINKRDGSWKAECQKRLALENQIIAKLCLSRIHSSEVDRIRISNTAMNDLSEGDFVFMVVDMMKNSGWYGQADRILEFVGLNVGLKIKETTKRKRKHGCYKVTILKKYS